MKPRFLDEKLTTFGETAGRSESPTPNHVASVAAYWSDEIVGMKTPPPPHEATVRTRQARATRSKFIIFLPSRQVADRRRPTSVISEFGFCSPIKTISSVNVNSIVNGQPPHDTPASANLELVNPAKPILDLVTEKSRRLIRQLVKQ